jgi:hypothetical protein
MPYKCKTPAGTGASRDSFTGLSLTLSTPLAIQTQFLVAAHQVWPEMAAMIAAIGGGACHG